MWLRYGSFEKLKGTLPPVPPALSIIVNTKSSSSLQIMNMIERLDVSGRGERASCKGDSYPWPGRWRRSSPMGRWWGGWWRRSDHVDGVKAFNVSTQINSTPSSLSTNSAVSQTNRHWACRPRLVIVNVVIANSYHCC